MENYTRVTHAVKEAEKQFSCKILCLALRIYIRFLHAATLGRIVGLPPARNQFSHLPHANQTTESQHQQQRLRGNRTCWEQKGSVPLVKPSPSHFLQSEKMTQTSLELFDKTLLLKPVLLDLLPPFSETGTKSSLENEKPTTSKSLVDL